MNDFVGLPYEKPSKTSKKAAKSMVPHAPNQRQRIWEFLHERGGQGATCDEVEAALDIVHPSCSTRLLELRRMGRIEFAGERRKTRSGREAEVYVALEPLFWTDKRPGWPTPPHTKKLSYGQGFAAGVKDAAELIGALQRALRGLRREKSRYYPEGCWCEACIGNPMVTHHTTACLQAQRVMKDAEDES
jgi:hypothetical protein